MSTHESKKKTSNNKRNIILTRYTIAPSSSFSRSSRLSVCYFSSRIYLADVRSKINRILTFFNSANYSCRERKGFSILPSSFYSLHPVTNNRRSRPLKYSLPTECDKIFSSRSDVVFIPFLVFIRLSFVSLVTLSPYFLYVAFAV